MQPPPATPAPGGGRPGELEVISAAQGQADTLAPFV